MVSSAHNVCPKGYYIAIVSTIAENDANHHIELEPGFERLGAIEEKFMGPPIPIYEPLESGKKDNVFISKSYDSTSHFETTTCMLSGSLMKVSFANIILKTIFGICTSAPPVKNSRLRDCGRASSLLKSRENCVDAMG